MQACPLGSLPAGMKTKALGWGVKPCSEAFFFHRRVLRTSPQKVTAQKISRKTEKPKADGVRYHPYQDEVRFAEEREKEV